ncbi:MAG: hypothetical protein K2I26_05280 [Paramuribaculum sp.]|nr:hypothetical protein [Paramuribaculum sp.]
MKKIALLLFIISSYWLTGCNTVDSDRIPPVNVNLIFTTIGEWELYGVSGAGSYQRFIAPLRQPAGFPYKGLEGTGFGGLLLVADPMGDYQVFDLGCPVCVPEVSRIVLDGDADVAGIFRCNKCGSTYDVFAYGTPRSGPALSDKYGLQRYRITFTGSSPYAIISR